VFFSEDGSTLNRCKFGESLNMFPVAYYTAGVKGPVRVGTDFAIAKLSCRDIRYLLGLFELDLQCYQIEIFL